MIYAIRWMKHGPDGKLVPKYPEESKRQAVSDISKAAIEEAAEYLMAACECGHGTALMVAEELASRFGRVARRGIDYARARESAAHT